MSKLPDSVLQVIQEQIDQAPGLYLVRVVTNTGEVWTRLLKQ